MESLRARLMAWLIGLLTAVGLLAGLLAYWLDREEVGEALDTQLKQIAWNVGDVATPVAPRDVDGASLDSEDEFVVTIWDAGAPHSSNSALDLPRPLVAGYTQFRAAGEEWRAYALVKKSRAIQVAQRIVVRQEFATNSALRAVLPIAALIPLSWFLVGWVVTRVLAPLGSLTDQLRRWGERDSTPLSLAAVPAEVLPLARATNELITRLQDQLEFRQRFISDAAHELRTPLTALRLLGQSLRPTVTSAPQKELVDDMERGLRRMAALVGQMLNLARADNAHPAPRSVGQVRLEEAIAASVEGVLPLATQKNIDIGLVSCAPGALLADPDELRTLIGNLLDNAVRYTPPGGLVDIRVTHAGERLVLEVTDTGPGIPENLHERVFDRFFRAADPGSEGSGLGLAIVRAVAERCGARVSIMNRQDRSGLIARVSFIRQQAA